MRGVSQQRKAHPYAVKVANGEEDSRKMRNAIRAAAVSSVKTRSVKTTR